MKIVTLVAAFLFGETHFSTPLLAQDRQPIIDMQLHADLPPFDVPAGTLALCRPDPCRGEGLSTVSHAETFEKKIEAMERYNIVKAFLSGVDLEIVREWTAAHPGRFVASPFILGASASHEVGGRV